MAKIQSKGARPPQRLTKGAANKPAANKATPANKAPKPKVGRPPKADIHDPKVVERICNLVASGVSIGEVCRRKDFPAESTVYLHMANDETFRSLIARAREAQQEREADKTVELADKATPENWQVVKLRIWARQWRAAKLAPKKYGEKQTLEHSGPDGGAIETRDVSPRDEIERRLKGIAERVATNVAPPAKKK